MIITQADLSTTIYAEIITEITRADTTIVPEAIILAQDEVKAFLNRYDLLKMFGDDTVNPVVPATFTSPMLTNLVKDITIYHVIRLGNPNISYEHVRVAYEDAMATLKSIQKMQQSPFGWPYLDTTDLELPDGDTFFAKSTPPRNSEF